MSSTPERAICVAVVSAGPEDRPPGLSAISSRAELVHVNTQGQLEAVLPRAEVLLVTDFRTSLVRDTWHAAGDSLRWVHATSAGVDRLVFPALLDSDVMLTNAAGVFDAGIAEYVIGAIVAFAKDFLGSLALQRTHTWKHRETQPVAGRHLLVVGAGSIGTAIATRARALGMHVTGIARTERTQHGFERVLAQSELDEALSGADYVVLAAPLTTATHHMIGARQLACMRAGARLINIGRGSLVVTEALVAALECGHLGGAALDVFEQEPLPVEHALWELPNVLLSAHMSGDVVGWREALTAQFIELFSDYERGKPLRNVVDKGRYASDLTGREAAT